MLPFPRSSIPAHPTRVTIRKPPRAQLVPTPFLHQIQTSKDLPEFVQFHTYRSEKKAKYTNFFVNINHETAEKGKLTWYVFYPGMRVGMCRGLPYTTAFPIQPFSPPDPIIWNMIKCFQSHGGCPMRIRFNMVPPTIIDFISALQRVTCIHHMEK